MLRSNSVDAGMMRHCSRRDAIATRRFATCRYVTLTFA
jgi:hypothetical protein